MPNHVTNIITASPEVIKAITRKHTAEQRAEHDANEAKTAANYKERTGNDWPYPAKQLPERYFTFADIIPEPERIFHGGCDGNHPHPHPDGGFYDHCWYEWNRSNWGTKWDAYDQSIEPLPGDLCKLQFDTAWSHPVPVMEALVERLAKEFPDEVVKVEYADEDFGYNVGRYTIEGGEIVDQQELSDTDEGRELAAKIKYGQTYAEVKAGWDEDEIDSARRYVLCKRVEKAEGVENGYTVIREKGLEVPEDVKAAITTVEQAESVFKDDSLLLKQLVG